MNVRNIVVPTIAFVALCAVAYPASADQQRDRRNRGGQSAEARGAPADNRASQRQSRDTQASQRQGRDTQAAQNPGNGRANRDNGANAQSWNNGGANPRGSNGDASRGYQSQQGPQGRSGYAVPRGSYSSQNNDSSRNNGGYSNNASRGGSYNNNYGSSRSGGYNNSYGGSHGNNYAYRDNRYSGYGNHNRYAYRSYYGGLSGSFYAFSPHLHLGFGLWVGYPMAFPNSAYLYGYNSTYPAFGGLSFEIEPGNAQVIIDGRYVGMADEYGPYRQPLSLPVGMHHVEVVAPGCRPVVYDVNVLPGQLIPYRGRLESGNWY